MRGCVEGSIAVDGINAQSKGAHLRWFIVSENWQGNGMGNALIEKATDFCRSRDYKWVYLWSFKGLSAAAHLYRKFGFEIIEQHLGTTWGTEVMEQCYQLKLG
jgi:GNAT superfamily N-acetyltransferase